MCKSWSNQIRICTASQSYVSKLPMSVALQEHVYDTDNEDDEQNVKNDEKVNDAFFLAIRVSATPWLKV